MVVNVDKVWVKAYVASLSAGCPDSGKTEMSHDSQRVGVPQHVERVLDAQDCRRGKNTRLTSSVSPNAGHRYAN